MRLLFLYLCAQNNNLDMKIEDKLVAPSTKKAIIIPAKKVAKFKPGAELADAIK